MPMEIIQYKIIQEIKNNNKLENTLKTKCEKKSSITTCKSC